MLSYTRWRCANRGFGDVWFDITEGEDLFYPYWTFWLWENHTSYYTCRSRRPTNGVVLDGAKEVNGPSLDRAVVFQNTLMPWMTVMDNIAFAVSL